VAIAVRTRILVRVISRFDDRPSASTVCSWSPACQSTRPPTSGIHSPDAVVLEQRRHRRVLVPVERPLVLPDHDRVPSAVRVRQLGDQRGGLRAPRPRQGAALTVSKKSATITPCHRGQDHGLLQLPRLRHTGSCQSSVETRP
jgi:hypothetical protein